MCRRRKRSLSQRLKKNPIRDDPAGHGHKEEVTDVVRLVLVLATSGAICGELRIRNG